MGGEDRQVGKRFIRYISGIGYRNREIEAEYGQTLRFLIWEN